MAAPILPADKLLADARDLRARAEALNASIRATDHTMSALAAVAPLLRPPPLRPPVDPYQGGQPTYWPRGLRWFYVGPMRELYVVAGPLHHSTAWGTIVARFTTVPEHAERVEDVARRLLDTGNPPPRGEATQVWWREWTGEAAHECALRGPRLIRSTEGDVLVQCVYAAAWQGAVDAACDELRRLIPDAMRPETTEHLGCRVERARAGLYLLGDHTDGRRRAGAKRRAARETAPPRPTLRVERGGTALSLSRRGGAA